MRKLVTRLAPAVVVAAVTVGVAASSAGAAACTKNVLCNKANEALRDDTIEPPTGGDYGASGLAVNTAGPLRLKTGPVLSNENPKGYAFFGVKLDKNPASANCNVATGWVEFVDIQHASLSEVFTGEAPLRPAVGHGGLGPWPISVNSDLCSTNPGKVTIENASLYFPLAGLTATGTFTGKWVQPGKCEGGSGGVELDIAQPGVTLSNKEKAEVDNAAGGHAFVCFVSSNNQLFPEKAPTWTPLVGEIWKD